MQVGGLDEEFDAESFVGAPGDDRANSATDCERLARDGLRDGQLDHLISEPFALTLDSEVLRNLRHASAPRLHLLSVIGWVFEERLHVGWTYSDSLHRRGTVAALAESFITRLRSILVGEPSVTVDSPADFPLAELDQQQFQRVVDLLGQLDEQD